ncbi:MAG: hypothetical protein ABSE07_12425 [Methanoregula sp.]|jgi:hypothetical protein
MGKRGLGAVIFVLILVMVMMAGCASRSPQTKSISTTNPVPTMTSDQSYVEEVTPFITPTAQRQTYPIITAATQPPEDIVCMVYSKKQVFTSDSKDAISFNLVNPPMYFNYSILDTKSGPDGKYTSYYTITISDKKTGAIYNQIGFGKDTMNGGYFNFGFGGSNVIKILSTGELQIETAGKDITLITEIWVKPVGNLASPFDTNSTKCINWPETRWVKLENPSIQ